MAKRKAPVLGVAASACGVLTAWTLHYALQQPTSQPEPEAAPVVKMHIRSRPAPVAAVVPEVRKVAIETPKPLPAPKPPKVKAPEIAAKAPPEVIPETKPPVIIAESVDLVQPGMPTSVPGPVLEAPSLVTENVETPEAPPDSYQPDVQQYAEKPGGDILVLGLLVDATGQVLDTKIIIPSHSGLGDLSYAMVARRQRITQLDPPLQPGETRWLEVRVQFPKNQDILP